MEAQSFIGFSQSQNTITEVYNNPCFAVTNDALQVSLGGLSVFTDNNGYAYSKAGDDRIKLVGNYDRSAYLNVDIWGPSFSFKVRKKYYFAITSRTRFLFNADHFSSDVFNLIDSKADTNHVYTINNFSAAMQMFTEVNLVYAGYIYHSEDQTVTGGFSLKYLVGNGAVTVGLTDVQFRVLANNTINNVQGTGSLAFTPLANQWLSTGAPLSAIQHSTLNTGLGLDLGLLYTYSPNGLMHTEKDNYTFRVGASITDIGSINYTASSTTGTYTAHAKSADLSKAIDKNTDKTYGQYIESYIQDSSLTTQNNKSKFKLGLPTALHLNADFFLMERVFFNANLLVNLRKSSASDPANHYLTTFAATPRYMIRKEYGVALPFTFNAYNQGTIGLIFYAGPLYIGTSTLLNLVALKNIRQADAFAGLSFHIKSLRREHGYERMQ